VAEAVPMRRDAAARVLVVEDADAIRTAVESGLLGAGHEVVTRPDGRELERVLVQSRPDVVVLDVMLPRRDGFALLDVVRSRSNAGVVMLTARDGIDDRLRGLSTGADDYVTKPFVLAELLARVNALLRRLGEVQSTMVVGDMVVDPEAGSVVRGGSALPLTATEFKLVCYLAEHRGKVLSKTQILSAVWGFDAYDPNLVEVHISALRRKLEEHGPRLLHTLRGLGYVLRAEEPLTGSTAGGLATVSLRRRVTAATVAVFVVVLFAVIVAVVASFSVILNRSVTAVLNDHVQLAEQLARENTPPAEFVSRLENRSVRARLVLADGRVLGSVRMPVFDPATRTRRLRLPNASGPLAGAQLTLQVDGRLLAGARHRLMRVLLVVGAVARGCRSGWTGQASWSTWIPRGSARWWPTWSTTPAR
jgi:two-component system, OmpR family, response regulator